MAESTLYQFTGSALEPVTWCQMTDDTVVAADSWRVVDGRVVGLDKHLDRFRGSVNRHSPASSGTVDAFITSALALLPRTGQWFPRVECVSTPHGDLFRFYHRVAPARLTDAVLATADHDPRTQPTTKGPDLDRLMALRKSVGAQGATEAVILTADGAIAEGAYSSLVAWRLGGNQMAVVDSAIPRIPSVTEQTLIGLAHAQGISVVEETMTPESLEGAMVWVVSALHGIRQATAWVNGPTVHTDDQHYKTWQEKLTATSQALA